MSISLAITSPGAIPDLNTLTATAQDWLDRDDLAAKVPIFVAMAEAMFNRELRSPKMERTVTFDAASEDTPLPSDYLAMRAIYQEGSPDRPLKAIALTAIRDGYDGTAGTPTAFALVSGGIRLIPPPDSLILLTMDYWAQIEPLSVLAPSNWLLQDHPDAYLYAVLFYAEMFLDNEEKATAFKGLLDQTVQRINREANNDRYGAGPLVPSAVAQVRGGRF